MPQRVRAFRESAVIEFSANNRVSEELSRGHVYRELAVRLTGAPTLTGANNTKAKTALGDEWGVVKKIEIIANGVDVIKSISGNALWWLNYFQYGVPPQITAAIGDAATANVPFDSVLIIPFWYPRSIRSLDTALDSRNLSSLEVVVEWGTFTDVNTDATAWTTNPQITVHSLKAFNISGPFSKWRVFPIETTITASNPQLQIPLSINQMYRGFLINTSDAGVDQGDILNNFKLISGGTVFADIHCQDDVMAQWSRLRNGVVRPYDQGAGAYDALRQGTPNALAGWYWYDHVTDGYMSEAIDTMGFSEFMIEADVTVGGGTTKMTVWPMQLVPVRGRR